MAETKQLGVRVPADLYRELQSIAKQRGIPLTWLVVDALKLHLTRLQKQAG
jgi:predicted transcriptional regulator